MNGTVIVLKQNKQISVELELPEVFSLNPTSGNSTNPVAHRVSHKAKRSLIELEKVESGCLLDNSEDGSYSEVSQLEENYFSSLVGLERRFAIQYKLISSNKHLEREILNLSEELKDFIVPIKNLAYEKIDMLPDNLSYSDLLKSLKRIRLSIRELSGYIVFSRVFEGFVLLIIILNVVLLSVESPDYPSTNASRDLDFLFIAVYTLECSLKILANGFFFEEEAYLRDWWNFIDFIIVLTSWVSISGNSSMNLKSLRTLRILRPLRGVSSVQGIRVLILALYLSLKPLINSMIILFITISIFAIIGLQLWIGALRNRCLSIDYGLIGDVCGFKECPINFKCAQTINNPLYGTVSFDSFFYSWLNVFQIITLEGWTKIFNFTSDAFSGFSVIFYIFVVLFGSLLILNLTVAVLTTSFTAAYQEVSQKQNLKLTLGEILKKKRKNSIRKTVVPYDILLESKADSLNSSRLIDVGAADIENGLEFLKTGDADINKADSSALNVFAPTLAWRNSEKYKHEILKSFQYARVFTVKSGTKNIEKLYINDAIPLSSSSQKALGKDFLIETGMLLGSPVSGTKKLMKKYSEFDFFTLFNFLQIRSSKKAAFFKMNFSVKDWIKSDESVELELWSGNEVNPVQIAKSLEFKSVLETVRIVKLSNLEKFQLLCLKLCQNKFFNVITSSLVIVNILALSSHHYGISKEGDHALFLINSLCTWFFIIEFILKLISSGAKRYLRDYINILEFFIIILSLLDFFFSQSTGFNAFRALRVLRLFRVIRVFRIFRYLDSIAQLISIISNSMSKFMYLLLLLLLIHLIFTLLAMEIYGNRFNFPDGIPRSNFDSFHWAFVTIFQVLSNENWDGVLRDAMRSDAGHWSSIFLVVWIIIGNFIILNLFLAILLGGFELDYNIDLNDEDVKKSKNVIYKSLLHRKTKELKVKELYFQKYVENSIDSENQDYSLEEIKKITFSEKKISDHGSVPLTSFGFLSSNNSFRKFLLRVVLDTKFEILILVLTILNLISLIWETYTLNVKKSSPESEAAKIIDITFTIFFLFEFIMKALALGFVSEPGTYLRDHWNKLDLVILILSLIDISMTSVELSVIKVLRSLRILRPLKLIRYNTSMKIVIKALFGSIMSSLNVIAVISLFWLIFAILGVSLFNGKLYSCENLGLTTQAECERSGFEWKNFMYNYDNIFEASLTLFIISSQETWPERMFNVVDALASGKAPALDNNPGAAYYVIFYVFIGDFFLINLFTIVVYTKFEAAKQEESSLTSVLLTRKQQDWIEVQRLVIQSKPVKLTHAESGPAIRRILHKVVSNDYFKIFMLIIIVINTVQMAMIFEGSSTDYDFALMVINDICTYLFILEALMKIIGLGPKSYFQSNWNRFDLLVVVSSVTFMITQEYLDNSLKILKFGPQVFRIFRVLRISRIVKLFQGLKYLQDMIHVVIFSMPAALNVLCLMMIIFMMYSILGVYLFWQVSGSYLNDDWNFSNFHKAMLVLWRISTGEDYPYIMKECIEYYDSKAVTLYFTSFVTIINFVLLEFFVSVIIQNYQEYVENPMSAVHIFNTFVKQFRNVWTKHSKEFHGSKIKYESLNLVFKDLGKEIGVNGLIDSNRLKKLVFSMKIYVDLQGFIYYHDLLYAFIRRKYSRMMNGKSEEFVRRILERQEIMMYQKLKEVRHSIKKRQHEHLDNHDQDPGKLLSGFYYMKVFFDGWKKFHRIRMAKQARCRNIVVTSYDS